MKNKKEIDMIVGILNSTNERDYKTWGEYYNGVANSILTKLKENEIVLAGGEVKNFNGEYWIGDNSEYSITSKIKDYEGKNIILRVVKDE